MIKIYLRLVEKIVKRFRLKFCKIVEPHELKENEIYVIQREWIGNGFLSNWFYVNIYAGLSLERKAIPVVDMKSFSSQYDDSRYFKRRNSWYIHFKNKSEPKNSCSIKYSPFQYLKDQNPVSYKDHSCVLDKDKLHTFYKGLNFIAELQDDLIEKINLSLKNIDLKTLAVHYRGTDKYILNKTKYKNHEQTADVSEYFKKIDELDKKYDFNVIFIATDSIDFIEKARNRYKVKIICNDFNRSSGDIGVHNLPYNNPVELGNQVLIDVYTMSACKYFVHGNSNVAHAVLVLKGNLNNCYYLKGN
jgi:hypothetical protein